MTTFIVQGRRFNNRLEAIAFAQQQAEHLDRSVDVRAEVARDVTQVERVWVARMHPPGFVRNPAMEKTA